MQVEDKINSLYEELYATKKKKDSLKKTTREYYNVLTLLISYYEKQIRDIEDKYQLSA